MGLIIISLVIIFFVNIYLYFLDCKKNGILYSLVMGIIFGFLAYNFIPEITYDLTRHHHIVDTIINLPKSYIFNYLHSLDLEILPKLLIYFVSLTGNHNFLQFIIVSIGYAIIFYMLYDYRKKSNLKFKFFLPIVLYTIFGFHILYFFSGLFCIFSIIIFSFAFYLDYQKKSNKYLCFVLYGLSLLMHNSALFPLVFLVIFKIANEKFDYKILFISFALYFSIGNILEILNSFLKFDFIDKIYYMYNAYTTKNELFSKFYTGYTLVIELSKIFFVYFICIFMKNDKTTNKGVYNFIMFFSIMELLMLFRARVIIRFANLIQFIGLPIMMDLFSNDKKSSVLYYLILIFLMFLYLFYFVHLLNGMNFKF